MGWPDRRLIDRLGLRAPIVQAPMANATSPEMVAGAILGGALGSLPCATLSAQGVRDAVATVRSLAPGPLALNFFCHVPPADDPAAEARWRARLDPYYRELGIADAPPPADRAPFDATMCELVEALRPEAVSFHFGLPEPALLDRVRASGTFIFATATTAGEARWLAERGVDAIVAQGHEAGGHHGWFLEPRRSPIGTMALVPAIADAVALPVVAAGGIADGRGIAAALALGAAAVQIGTAYLFTPEAPIGGWYRAALDTALPEDTVLTNVASGREARGLVNRLIAEVGPLSPDAPRFPRASRALAALRLATEARGSGDFSAMWMGQGVRLGWRLPARTLTERLAADALDRLRALAARA